MAKAILTDEMRKRIPHVFPATPRPKGGRTRVDYRLVLTGILFILRTGIPWHLLLRELGCGSGMTCWRRLRDGQKEGVWQHLLEYFVPELKQGGRLADDRLIVDASLVAAKKGPRKRMKPLRSRQTWLQTSFEHRRTKRSSRCWAERRQRQ